MPHHPWDGTVKLLGSCTHEMDELRQKCKPGCMAVVFSHVTVFSLDAGFLDAELKFEKWFLLRKMLQIVDTYK